MDFYTIATLSSLATFILWLVCHAKKPRVHHEFNFVNTPEGNVSSAVCKGYAQVNPTSLSLFHLQADMYICTIF